MEVTYTYYLDVYGGNMIPESRWQSLELKVRARLNHYTFNRMESGAWMAEAKAALCEMCEALFQENERGGKTSENTVGYSVGYDTSIPVGQKLYHIAEMYLQGTGLMDLGVE